MFCKYCGAPIADDSKFCPNCGQCLMEEKEPTPEETAETKTNSTSETLFTNDQFSAAKEKDTTEWGAGNPKERVFPPNIAENQIDADPFTGKAHPSVKRNLIIAGIVVGIATVLGIFLMIVGMISAYKSGAIENGTEALDIYEGETFPADPNEFNPSENTPIDLQDAGNTVGNSLNIGTAVDDGEGGVYYCDGDIIYHRSENDEITEITHSDGNYFSNINKREQVLYYITNFTDSNRQEIMSYDLETETETLLTTADEIINYMMAYGDELYYATKNTIYAIHRESRDIRTVYVTEKTLYDVFTTEDGIYYSQTTADSSYQLYRRNFRGEEEQYITTGDFFDFSNGTLYINRMDEYGNDILYQADSNGNEEKEIYRFSDANEAAYIVGMQIRDNICYCIRETLQYDDDLYYEVQAVNITDNEEHIIDKDFTSEENPFCNLNIAGRWLFYYDTTFSYGLHIYELPM